MSYRWRDSRGFSLMELMVSVAIVGILSSMAVPAYMRFAAKARQSEAKMLLSGLYSAETLFHVEWEVYFADWRDIGFLPEGQVNYLVGFSVPYDPIPAGLGYTGASYGGPQPNPTIGAVYVNNNNTYCAVVIPNCPFHTMPTAFAAIAAPVWSITNVNNGSPQSFLAGASSEISGDPNVLDSWTVDSDKNLVNVTSGL